MNGSLERFERREAERRSKIVGARILSADGLAIGATTVCNLSSTGAMMRSRDSTGLEGGFCLLIDGESRVWRCVIAWKSGNQIGVRFLQPDATQTALAADLLGREAMRIGWGQLPG